MIEKLACKLGRNDEVPNIELAELLCQTDDTAGIKEIVAGLNGKDTAVANDCIKVLYEVGERKPALISAYANEFLAILYSRNNRLVWGGMTALAAIADTVPADVYKGIDRILAAKNNSGSVIAVDNSITVLAKLCKSGKEYEAHVFPLLLEHLRTCRPKEVGQHAERAAVCVNKGNAQAFLDVLNYRKNHLADNQIERLRKLENKIAKQIK